MYNKLKKIFLIIYGSNKNIFFGVSVASLITSIILTIFMFLFQSNKVASLFFTYAAASFFAIWLILTRGIDSTEKLGHELIRLVFFLIVFIASLSCLLQIDKHYIKKTFACLGLFSSCIYFVFKLNDIFSFVKSIFNQLKIKLFNTDKPTSTGIKSVIENITVFLVSIGGFFIALKTIIETVLQISKYL